MVYIRLTRSRVWSILGIVCVKPDLLKKKLLAFVLLAKITDLNWETIIINFKIAESISYLYEVSLKPTTNLNAENIIMVAIKCVHDCTATNRIAANT